MKASFELFQHTADMGVRVRASTRAQLIYPATQGLYAVIGDLYALDSPEKQKEFEFSGEAPDYLLRDFLAEILYYFDHMQEILHSVTVNQFSSKKLKGQLFFRPLDRSRSVYNCEVKAVTYHQLSLLEKDHPEHHSYFEATVVVDI